MVAQLHAQETVGHKHVGFERVCGVSLSQPSTQSLCKRPIVIADKVSDSPQRNFQNRALNLFSPAGSPRWHL